MLLPKIILLKKNTLAGPSTIPTKAYIDDAGYDLYCAEDKWVWPFSCTDIETGWDVKIPDHFWGSIQSRSSTFKRRKLVVFGGVMDPGYVGKLSILVWNPFFWPKKIKSGERLAQLIIHPIHDMKFAETSRMPITTRSNRSFGSSGA
jgi:dUTP pyrophosphatase